MNKGERQAIMAEIIRKGTLTGTMPVARDERVEAEMTSLGEELATAILGRMQEASKLKLRFVDSNLTTKEKLESIINFKSSLVVPALKKALGLSFDEFEISGTYAVINILNSIEASINNLVRFEESENVDFSHPKIIESYRMLFEVFLEVLEKEELPSYVVKSVVEKTAIRCVNIENEFQKTFKNVSNRVASLATNPLLDTFKNKNRDPLILKKRLYEELARFRSAIGEDYNLTEVNNLLLKLEMEIKSDDEKNE